MGHYILADILLQLGKTEEAKELRKAVKGHYVVDIFPYRPEEIKVLDRASKDETDAVAVYLKGCILYDKLHSEEAAECFEEAIRRDPESYFAYRCLGAAYFSRLDRREEALLLYKKAMELLETNTGNTIFIGDQLFTDVYGAKRSGIRNILVKPIHPKEEIQMVLKRYLEKIVLHFYKKEEGIS